jgi:2-methylcitrate dehydratase PrpD
VPDALEGGGGLERELGVLAASLRFEDLPGEVVQVAGHCLLDWLGAAIRGAREPGARLVFAAVAAQAGGGGPATAIGRSERLGALDAALVNGVAGHVLELDDSHVRMQAHPSAALLPGLLALAELRRLPPRDVLAALVAGIECGAPLGDALHPGHYRRGWHASATLGALAAAAAGASLLRLDEERARSALGLAAVQAGGLRAAFGSLAKPFQVGRAAAAGLLAALTAERAGGLPGPLLEGPLGFLEVYGPPAPPAPAVGGWATREVLFKRHASCHGTQATLEAIATIRAASALDPGAAARVVVAVPQQLRSVCGIDRPADGAALRFSLRGVAAMALLGLDTSDPAAFADAVVARPDHRALLERVEVAYLDGRPDFGGEARVEVIWPDGTSRAAEADVALPAADLDRQGAELRAKFERLVAPCLGPGPAGRLVAAIDGFAGLGAVAELTALCRAPEPGRP